MCVDTETFLWVCIEHIYTKISLVCYRGLSRMTNNINTDESGLSSRLLNMILKVMISLSIPSRDDQ